MDAKNQGEGWESRRNMDKQPLERRVRNGESDSRYIPPLTSLC